MPRRLLRDGQIVDDEWQYLAETAGNRAASLILTVDQWLNERDVWSDHGCRLGVILAPTHKVEILAADIPRFALIGAEFPGPSDGRAYTQGRLLRERWNFTGELRATGYVRRDQLFFMARCGFNSFELPDSDIGDAATAFSTFSAAYQPANDLGLARELQHRQH